MTPSDLIQVILMGLLVVVTGIYAWRTHVISKATNEQAKAIKEQRYSESLPLLVPEVVIMVPKMIPTEREMITSLLIDPRVLHPNEVPYECLQTGKGMKVLWHNQGKGIAINIIFSFIPALLDHQQKTAHMFGSYELKTLGTGGRKEIEFSVGERNSKPFYYNLPKGNRPYLRAEYKDIYERRITTIQEFFLIEEREYYTAFLGDLYFTVNGRRLGEEVIKHD